MTGCPVYHPEARESRGRRAARRATVRPVPRARTSDLGGRAGARCSTSPTIATKRWVYEQYDTSVRTNTVVGPGGDAAVLRVRGTAPGDRGDQRTATAATCYLDPHVGGKAAVAEAARNVACDRRAAARRSPTASTSATRRSPRCSTSSARPCRGMADACRAFGTPVTGGNVSFYNESPRGAVLPDADDRHGRAARRRRRRHVPAQFQAAGDRSCSARGAARRSSAASSTCRWITARSPARRRACDLARGARAHGGLLVAMRRPGPAGLGARLPRRRARRRAGRVLRCWTELLGAERRPDGAVLRAAGRRRAVRRGPGRVRRERARGPRRGRSRTSPAATASRPGHRGRRRARGRRADRRSGSDADRAAGGAAAAHLRGRAAPAARGRRRHASLRRSD